jgi:hypothetical protein
MMVCKVQATWIREKLKQVCEVTEDQTMDLLLSRRPTNQLNHTCSSMGYVWENPMPYFNHVVTFRLLHNLY